MSDKQPRDERDAAHPQHQGAAQQQPDPTLQREVAAAEYVSELEAMVSYLRRRVRALGVENAMQDKTQRQLVIDLELVTEERDRLAAAATESVVSDQPTG